MQMNTLHGILGTYLLVSSVGEGAITFDGFTPNFSLVGPMIGPLTTDGFTFVGADPYLGSGTTFGVSIGPSVPVASDNGTPFVVFRASVSFGRTDGGAFFLQTVDMGQSWYSSWTPRPVYITLTLPGGETTRTRVNLYQSFSTFSIGMDVTSVTISEVYPNSGFFALDNVNVVTQDTTPSPNPVPEPSTYLAGLSALGMLGMFGWRNRK